MCRSLSPLIAYAVGLVVVGVTSLLIYQWVTVVQVVVPPSAPVFERHRVQQVPPGMIEPMELDHATPAGRILAMPRTGQE